MSEPIWVAELLASPRTRQKISGRHEFDIDDVRHAVVAVEGLTCAWHLDPERGPRAMVQTRIRGRRCLVVLYPVDHPMGDVWNLGSVYEKPA